MAQKGRPSADTYLGNYVDELDGVTNIYTSIDEVLADDDDWVQSESAPSTSAYATKLGTLVDPVSSSAHTLSYRYQKSSDGPQIDVVVQLREGYVNEGTLGTLIAANTHTDVPSTATAGSIALSGVQADAITDYDSLFVRTTMNQV